MHRPGQVHYLQLPMHDHCCGSANLIGGAPYKVKYTVLFLLSSRSRCSRFRSSFRCFILCGIQFSQLVVRGRFGCVVMSIQLRNTGQSTYGGEAEEEEGRVA